MSEPASSGGHSEVRALRAWTSRLIGSRLGGRSAAPVGSSPVAYGPSRIGSSSVSPRGMELPRSRVPAATGSNLVRTGAPQRQQGFRRRKTPPPAVRDCGSITEWSGARRSPAVWIWSGTL